MIKSDFSYKRINNIFVIEDLNLGNKSVTNDIENVLEKVRFEMQQQINDEFNLDNFRIIYKDSNGIYDGIRTKDNKFVYFIPLHAREEKIALKKISEHLIKEESRKISTYARLGNEPEAYHFVKTGFQDLYFALYESAYDGCEYLGQMNKQQIKKKYNIDLEI